METDDTHTHFTSDTHFGHANIIRYSRRPFEDAQQMDEALIASWNAAVGDDDLVYHLGDFTLAGPAFAERVFARLRGRIRVLGNHWHHDGRWLPRGFGPSRLRSASGHAVDILPPMAVLDLPVAGRKQPIVLCHYPLARWDRGHHGAWHLHGHSHGTYRGEGAILDVGVDCHGYAPIRLDALPALLGGAEGAGEARPR
jgi:calcineurin-like phosphoesterase family protein